LLLLFVVVVVCRETQWELPCEIEQTLVAPTAFSSVPGTLLGGEQEEEDAMAYNWFVEGQEDEGRAGADMASSYAVSSASTARRWSGIGIGY
jgi:hypothetical protein